MSAVIKIEFTDNEKYITNEAKEYSNDVELIEKTIRESAAYRFCLLHSYRTFTKQGNMKRINDLDSALKKELYNQSLKLQPEKIESAIRGDICRIMWLFNYVFETYFI